MSNPTTSPDRDPAVSAFVRQHPTWTVWRSLNTRFYAILTARPIEKVMGETLAELSIEIRRHEDYLTAMATEESALLARNAAVGRRLDSGELTADQARELVLKATEEHLAVTRLIREARFGQS